MIELTVREIVEFYAGKDGDSSAPAVKLRLLRELLARADRAAEWQAECERLAGDVVALKHALAIARGAEVVNAPGGRVEVTRA